MPSSASASPLKSIPPASDTPNWLNLSSARSMTAFMRSAELRRNVSGLKKKSSSFCADGPGLNGSKRTFFGRCRLAVISCSAVMLAISLSQEERLRHDEPSTMPFRMRTRQVSRDIGEKGSHVEAQGAYRVEGHSV